MPVPESSAPRASETLAGSESAPKLMSETRSGISRVSGFWALGPITTSVPTGSSSRCGMRWSCAVMNWMSSQLGRSWRGTPMATTTP